MNKAKLTLALLVISLGATQVLAEPSSDKRCCEPLPVGGLAALEHNTIYPLCERGSGSASDVLISFHVDKSGQVSDVHVVSSGGSMFDKAAVTAVMKTQWTPATQNGYPVAVTYELPFEYRYK